MVKYVGQSNAYDIPNNIIYLGDLLFSWDTGDSLVGWTLGGNTVPTIAVDGRMRLYDATAGGGNSNAYYTIPNSKGALWHVVSAKLTRMVDDTSTDSRAMIFQFGGVTSFDRGHEWAHRGTSNQILYAWLNQGAVGALALASDVPAAGVETRIDLVLTPKGVIFLADGVQKYQFPVSMSPLSPSALQSDFAGDKVIRFQVGHAAGQVSHWRVRDIRVSRLVGQS